MRKARRAGFVVSVSLHAALLAAIVVQLEQGAFGVAGPTEGPGMNISLIDAASLEASISESQEAPAAIAQASPAPEPATQASDEFGSTAQEALSDPAADNAASPSDASSQSRSDSELAADSTGQGGDPRALGDLMARIAACLPADLRPALVQTRLVLDIGVEGDLQTAPTIETVGTDLSEADRLTADRLVQAALQCGPYDIEGLKGQIVPLAADFTALNPAQVAESTPSLPRSLSFWGGLFGRSPSR